jgi:hypothetical protein
MKYLIAIATLSVASCANPYVDTKFVVDTTRAVPTAVANKIIVPSQDVQPIFELNNENINAAISEQIGRVAATK